jgi:hypothetical protein
MERREFFKGLAMISLASGLAQSGCSHEKQLKSKSFTKDLQGRLNVVLHGMFAVVLDSKDAANKAVHLLAPKVSDHLYAAAAADVDPATSDIQWLWQQRIEPGAKTEVKIPSRLASTGSPTHLDFKLGFNKSRIVKIAGKEYWNTALPMPDEIWGVRASNDDPFNPNGMTYKWNALTVPRVPTVLVLTYSPIDLNAGKAPTFVDKSGASQEISISKTDNVARLHLFAESAFDLTNPDPNMALAEFNKLFLDASGNTALDLSIKPNYGNDPVAIDQSVNQPSVMICEERNLGELDIPCDLLPLTSKPSAHAATRVHNCMSIALDTTT